MSCDDALSSDSACNGARKRSPLTSDDVRYALESEAVDSKDDCGRKKCIPPSTDSVSRTGADDFRIAEYRSPVDAPSSPGDGSDVPLDGSVYDRDH